MMLRGPFLLFSSALICAGLIWKPVLAALTETPNDTIALLHSRTTLKCSTNSSPPIDWYFYPSATPSERQPIYLNEALTLTFQHKYKVNASVGGNFELIMESVDWSHVGTYLCHDEAGIGANASAKLTVLDPNPRWHIGSSENNGLFFPCSSLNFQFSYSGSQEPSLQWETGQKLKILNLTTFFGSGSTDKGPSNAKFINLTLDLWEQRNDTNYYLVCAWKVKQNPDGMKNEVVTHAISLQQLQSQTIVVLQCRSHSVLGISHPSMSEQCSGLLTLQPVIITATVLSTVIVLLVLHISLNRRNHARMKTADMTTAPVDVSPISVVTIPEFPSEPPYVNISNDTQHPAPLSSAAMESSAMSPKGHWNPVYAGMEAHRTARPGSIQVGASRRAPEGQEDQRPSEDRTPTPLNRMNHRGHSRGSDYLEIIP